MTDVTRTYYTNQINTLRNYPAGRTTAVNATDIARAANVGITAASPTTLPYAQQTDIDGSVDPTPAPIIGTDVRDALQARATTWSYVRTLRYQLTGNVSPAGSQYTRAAYMTAPPLTSSVPPTSSPVFDPLDTGEDIDLGDFNVILSTLGVLINSDADTEYPSVIFYCHSQCHSSCHGSRGRR